MNERVLQFGPSGRSVGILSDPRRGARLGAVFLNAGLLHRVGNCRLSVRVARRLAELGIPSYRFDFSGMGDSERRDDALSGLPASHEETCEAVRRFREATGVEEVVLLGLCRGADVAVRAAPELPSVTGLVLVDPWVYPTSRFYVKRYAPRILLPEVWLRAPATIARSMLASGSATAPAPIRPFPPREEVAGLLSAFVVRGGTMLTWFTGGYLEHYSYEGQFRDALPEVEFGTSLTERLLPDASHLVTAPADQRVVVDGTVEAIAAWGARSA